MRLWVYTMRIQGRNVQRPMGPDVSTNSLDEFWQSQPIVTLLRGRNPADMTAFTEGETLYPDAVGFDQKRLQTFVKQTYKSVLDECQRPKVAGRIDHVLVVNFLGQTRDVRTHTLRPVVVQGPVAPRYGVIDEIRRQIMKTGDGLLNLKEVEETADRAASALFTHRGGLFNLGNKATDIEIMSYMQWRALLLIPSHLTY